QNRRAICRTERCSLLLISSFASSECLFFLRFEQPPSSTLFPYTTLFRSSLFTIFTGPAAPARSMIEVSLQVGAACPGQITSDVRSEEHTSELQSLAYLVCRLLLEKKNMRSCLCLITLLLFRCSGRVCLSI